MPEISRFLGIVITMYYKDHGPPHFHAIYGDYACYDINSRGIGDREISKTSVKTCIGVVRIAQGELLENWELAQQRRALKSIAPLE